MKINKYTRRDYRRRTIRKAVHAICYLLRYFFPNLLFFAPSPAEIHPSQTHFLLSVFLLLLLGKIKIRTMTNVIRFGVWHENLCFHTFELWWKMPGYRQNYAKNQEKMLVFSSKKCERCEFWTVFVFFLLVFSLVNLSKLKISNGNHSPTSNDDKVQMLTVWNEKCRENVKMLKHWNKTELK